MNIPDSAFKALATCGVWGAVAICAIYQVPNMNAIAACGSGLW